MGFSYLGCLVMVCCLLLGVLVSGSTKNLPIINFDEGYSHLFGEDNLVVVRDGKSVHLSLDERTGCLLDFLHSFGVLYGFDFFLFFWPFEALTDSLAFWWCIGSGFVSQDLYLHGFFSASIKLPADYTAGVVVAFYVSYHIPLSHSKIP